MDEYNYDCSYINIVIVNQRKCGVYDFDSLSNNKNENDENDECNQICMICYDNTNDNSFYDYNLYRYTHRCECKPSIHLKCFELCIKKNIGCVICRTSIIIELSLFEKIKINFVMIIWCMFKLITLLFLRYVFPMICLIYILESLGLTTFFYKIRDTQECNNSYFYDSDYITDSIICDSDNFNTNNYDIVKKIFNTTQ
jgi:hypothetical protein